MQLKQATSSFASMKSLFRFLAVEADISPQPTVIPLRGLPSVELRRWASRKVPRICTG